MSNTFAHHLRTRLRLAWYALTGRNPGATADTAAPDTSIPNADALCLLALLQREGRLVDFLQEEILKHSDQQIGAAARLVHAGCKRALQTHFQIVAIRPEEEGQPVQLPIGFDPHEVSISGQVTGQPPFTGTLIHAGWRVLASHLPEPPPGHDPRILVPAEVEL